MDLDSRLQHVSVLGAAGKMGSGITLLVAQEMAKRALDPANKGKLYRLNAIDLDPNALGGLQAYIRDQATKTAEKSAVELRQLLAYRDDLVDNEEIIREYVHAVERVVWPTTDVAAAKGSLLVFEAIVEKIPVKTAVLKQVGEMCPEAYVFTNTSSVPIGLLDREAKLGGRIIGFHFYNPPPVQKLVEVIRAESTKDDVSSLAAEVGKRLRKTLIPSADIAGFIGNGHFIRDGIFGLQEASRLAKDHGWPKAAYLVNRVTQDWLVRPMGIFQLIDYVGIDVFHFIEQVMDQHLDEPLLNDVIDRMIGLGVLGGQKSDGSQKPGFLDYEKGKPTRVFDIDQKAYVPIVAENWDKDLGALPPGFKPWKTLSRAADKDAALERHFAAVAVDTTLGSELARNYVRNSRAIGEKLVAMGVAARPEDVNGVLTSGFFHLYGPINGYCK